MKILGVLEKRPEEIIPTGNWGIDFDPDLDSGETISSAEIVITDNDGTDVTATLSSGSHLIDGTTVTLKYIDGSTGQRYFSKCTITSSFGRVVAETFQINVGEVPNE